MSGKKSYEYRDLTHAANRLRELKVQKDILKEDLSEVNKEIEHLELKWLPKYFDDNEIEKVTVEDVGTIFLRGDLFVSMTPNETPELEPPFYDWAREHIPDLIKPYIHPNALKTWAKETLEGGRPIPSNLLKATFFQRANLRRK